MKKTVKILTVILGIAVIAGAIIVLASCNPSKGNETETSGSTETIAEETTGNTEITDDMNVTIDSTTAVINGSDMNIKLTAADNQLIINSLSTVKSGKNVMYDDSSFNLPASVKVDGTVIDVVWKFVKISKSLSEEAGYTVSTVNFVYRNEKYGLILNVAVNYHIGLDGPFEFVTTISNSTSDSVRINPGKFAGFDFEFVEKEYLWYFAKESGYAEGFTSYQGVHFNGQGTYTSEIKKTTKKHIYAKVYQDSNQNGYIPMVYLTNGTDGKYIALQWTSGMINVESDGKKTTVSVDMDDVSYEAGAFSTLIPAGDTFVFPTVFVGAFDGNVDHGSNEFKTFFFETKVPSELRDNPLEPYTQEDMQSGIATHGVEMVKWDYGWWSDTKTGDWSSLEGSWKLRNSSYISLLQSLNCSDLKRFGRTLNKADIKWTVYVLLHDTQSDATTVTDTEGEFNSITHPEWFSNRRIATGMGCSADLGNEECVAYLQKTMTEFFTENKITGWRSDFEPICYYSDKQNRHDANGTDVQYWCTVGYVELTTYLCEHIEGFRYENCSSGGSIKDLLTASVATIIQCDDSSNYLSSRMAFYDASFVIPPCQLELIDNADFANPTKDTFWPKVESGNMASNDFNEAMVDMGFRSQLLGCFCFSSWTGSVIASKYKEYSSMYINKLRDMIKHGELWHVLPRPDGTNWDGVMYSYKDSTNENGIKGALFVFKPSGEAGDSVHIVLDGLYEDRTYVLTCEDHTENNMTATGKELMTNGIDFTITDTIGSDIVWITEK